MAKLAALIFLALTVYLTEVSSQGYKVILPTYRPPPASSYPRIRTARNAEELEPRISEDDFGSERLRRSLDSPSAKRSSPQSSGPRSHDTGATHPGYNRRNTRSIDDESLWLYGDENIDRAPTSSDTGLPAYIDEVKLDPNRRYTRNAEDSYEGDDDNKASPLSVTSRDIENDNVAGGDTNVPNIIVDKNQELTKPGRFEKKIRPLYPDNKRYTREIRIPDIFDPIRRPSPTFPRPPIDPFFPNRRFPIYARSRREVKTPEHSYSKNWDGEGPTYREKRDVTINDVLKKPTVRDVIIPNWNPHVRTSPWQRIGGH